MTLRIRRLDAGAPTHLTVPSASPGDTSQCIYSRLGSAPIQITQDLRGFWDRTYAEVKKEPTGRYPKHPWPDDP